MGRRAMFLMGLFLTQGRSSIAFADCMQNGGHLGDESLTNVFIQFVKQAHSWATLLLWLFPEKNQKVH